MAKRQQNYKLNIEKEWHKIHSNIPPSFLSGHSVSSFSLCFSKLPLVETERKQCVLQRRKKLLNGSMHIGCGKDYMAAICREKRNGCIA